MIRLLLPSRAARRPLRALLAGLGAFWLASAAAQVRPEARPPVFETGAPRALLMDLDTGTILFEQKADEPFPPASLAKLMTARLVFRELAEGRLRAEGEMVVSTDAWRRGGAVSGNPNMLLTPNRVIKVDDVLNGLIVAVANDAALTLAQNLVGREEAFVEWMNAEARSLGLAATRYVNATGLPQPGQTTSLRDAATLAASLLRDFPENYPRFARRELDLGRQKIANRNPLLGMEIGADGLIAAFDKADGHMLVGSAQQEGRRLLVALSGVETLADRGLEARKLLDWGFRRFDIRTLFEKGAPIGDASVFGGAAISVPLRAVATIRLPVLRGSEAGARLKLVYSGPVPAPIREGDRIGRLDVLVDGRVIQSAPLEAASAVPEGNTLDRARDALLELSRQSLSGGMAWFLDLFRRPPRPAPGAPS